MVGDVRAGVTARHWQPVEKSREERSMTQHDKERIENLKGAVLGALLFLQDILAALPIPVALPDPLETGDLNPDSVIALDRARALLVDEPIPAPAQRAHESLVLEWFIAYELLVLATVAGPAGWRLDGAEFSLQRFATLAEIIENEDYGDI
jgi:hypothetical protein